MSRVVRIADDAYDLAHAYGSSVSEGVRIMDALIRELRSRSKDGIDEKAMERLIRTAVREEIEAAIYRG
ncbi:MAG: hypothetical protein D5R99_02865 [Methanocalculus sp. MSAO_Arc1]|uniref:hypothetical protein n=1 Tax=Methanocalculus TaxID=71151 RepID=UPI000FEFC94B|nr:MULTISPECIES: hypothetical protein [unclassified Methanocalculus]MCP1661908.1 hypothetical protein [Methanocalculus sp. AMF5]RQD81207.1 MAG: hypothetical protein D5R99_02865 [Methanocalculus sp. MSAO_Arc1]